jgi:outer membrane immunogenic protein
MKRILFTAAFIGLGSASAFAADVASRSYAQAPGAAPTGSWTGFYVGANVGGLWTRDNGTWDPLPSPALFGINTITDTMKGSSAAGGLHAGYNWQFAPTLLAGLEGDWTWTKPSGSFTQP